MKKLTHAESGAIGGRSKSKAKVAAARANAKLSKTGGRPGDPRIKAIMTERGVSRQRAHVILKKFNA